MLRRRTLLLVLLICFVFSANLYAGGLDVIELKLGHILSSTDPLNAGLVKFAELVEEKTNGSVKIKIFPASQLGTAIPQIDGVTLGSQEIFVGAISWGENFAGLESFKIIGIPNAFDDNEHLERFMDSKIGKQLILTWKEKYNLEYIAYNWHRPPRQVLSDRKVTNRKELAGLKIRVPEAVIWVRSWNTLGAHATPVAWGEVYTSLQQGVINAVEAPISLIYSSKFQERVKFLTLTNHVYNNVGLLINSTVFNSLSEEQKVALREAANEAGLYQNKLYAEAEISNLEKMKEEGVEVYELSDEERALFFEPLEKFAKEMEEIGEWPEGTWDFIRSLSE